MAYKKAILFSTELDIRASDAQAMVRYIVEGDKDDAGHDTGVVVEQDPNALNVLAASLPAIGSKQDFAGVQGAPNPPPALNTNVPNPENFTTHNMRVYRKRCHFGEMNNVNKIFGDVYYASRARPVIEFGSSAVQQPTQTYLTDESGLIASTDPNQLPSDSNDVTFRKQMVLDYKLKAGTYATGLPAADINLWKTSVDGTMFRFGSSARITSFWFNDEISPSQLNKLAQVYVSSTNKDPLFFADDAQRWLCTSLPSISTDGGWIWRASIELVYSPFGWDNYEVYIDPFTGQPAILSDDVLAALYKRGAFNNMPQIPAAYAPQYGGAGRFPQQLCRPMRGVVGYLSQGVLFEQPALSSVLNPSIAPIPTTLPDFGGSAFA